MKEANAVGYGDQEVNRKIWGAVNTWPAGDIFFFFLFFIIIVIVIVIVISIIIVRE